MGTVVVEVSHFRSEVHFIRMVSDNHIALYTKTKICINCACVHMLYLDNALELSGFL